MREEGAKLLLRKSDVGQAGVEQNKPVSFVKALLAAEAASPVGLGYRGFFEPELPSFTETENFFLMSRFKLRLLVYFEDKSLL
jgi:hypothetical protein